MVHAEIKGADGRSLISQAKMPLFSSSSLHSRSRNDVSLPHHPWRVDGWWCDAKHFVSALWMGASKSRALQNPTQTCWSCFTLKEKLVLAFPLGVQSNKTLPLPAVPAGCSKAVFPQRAEMLQTPWGNIWKVIWKWKHLVSNQSKVHSADFSTSFPSITGSEGN